MPNPTTIWVAVLVDSLGKVKPETTVYFATQNAARDGCKDMLRQANGSDNSVAIFKLLARLDMTVDYKVTTV